ncbi:MAG: MbcA/ParS/Xre antitoxin family protein [Rhodobacterales bacterium]|nr:MbcA/ParS/Xre antitoxin family protein [Rhodobacterales bacterium]
MPHLRLIDTPQNDRPNPPSNPDKGAPRFATDEVQAMQRAMISLGQRWALTDDQLSTLLGEISVRTLQRWKHGQYGRPNIDTSARMSNLLGIHKALRLLFKDSARGYAWIKRPNETFNGATALDVMLGGQLTDLMRVRRYLDSMRAPW